MPYKDAAQAAAYQKRYQRKNRKRLLEQKRIRRLAQRNFIWDAKRKPCTDCGVQYNPWVMDFDHVRGVKRYNLNRLTKNSASWETIKKEIAKCEVVCSNCHRERTHLQLGVSSSG